MVQTQTINTEIIEIISEIKYIVFFLRDTDLEIEDEKSARNSLIDEVKRLTVNTHLDENQRKYNQLILTKLYTWSPFHKDLSGLGDLPELVEKLFGSVEGLIPGEVELEEIIEAVHEIKYFKNDGKELIEEDSPVVINLSKALEEIESYPTIEEFNGNLLGFINKHGESINFIRMNEEAWMLDIPFTEEDEFSATLNTDSLTNDAVKEFIILFFQADGMGQIRKQLEISEHIKMILSYEMELGKVLTLTDIEQAIDAEDAEHYLNLLITPVDYEPKEIPMLKKKASLAFSKIVDPNLFELINNLGYDFFTAKKVGKFLIDHGWLKDFPRVPPSRN